MKALRLEKFLAQSYYIEPAAGAAFFQRILATAAGQVEAPDADEPRPVAARPQIDAWGDNIPSMQILGAMAIIPIVGVLVCGAAGSDKLFGAISHQDIAEDIDAALAADCTTLRFMVDCPGGSVIGTPELAAKIADLKAQGIKTESFNNRCCASAAEYLTAGVEKRCATPSSINGAIGTIMTTLHFEKMLTDAGIMVNMIASGKYKGMGHPLKNPTDAQREMMQQEINALTADFKAWMSEHRRLNEDCMQGQTFTGRQAADIGLIDKLVNNPRQI